MSQTKPFWEESYKRPGKLDTFGGGKPSQLTLKAVPLCTAGANTLDAGCGEGRNAIYLAGLGFKVSAFDISVSGIEKLRSVARERNLEIDASVGDLRDYRFTSSFDLIVCEGCLHLIEREKWISFIRRMKEATHPGGLNAVGVFTDTVPEPDDQRGMMVGLFKEGELREQYRDWEIIDTTVYRFTHTHPDGPTHEHAGNGVIARKPRA
jgi:tellurite methyltransferase